jgi:hypothetical protein
MEKRIWILATAGLVMVYAGAALAGQDRVDICHKGRTITVAAPALDAHFGHGDALCGCDVIEDCDEQGGTLDEDCACNAPGGGGTCEPAGTCDSEFTTCGNSQDCVCASATDGSGVCIYAASPCGIPCFNGDADCPGGFVCVVQSCCDVPSCVLDCAAE